MLLVSSYHGPRWKIETEERAIQTKKRSRKSFRERELRLARCRDYDGRTYAALTMDQRCLKRRTSNNLVTWTVTPWVASSTLLSLFESLQLTYYPMDMDTYNYVWKTRIPVMRKYLYFCIWQHMENDPSLDYDNTDNLSVDYYTENTDNKDRNWQTAKTNNSVLSVNTSLSLTIPSDCHRSTPSLLPFTTHETTIIYLSSSSLIMYCYFISPLSTPCTHKINILISYLVLQMAILHWNYIYVPASYKGSPHDAEASV